MKRLLTACAACAFSFTLLFNIRHIIPNIKVSAVDVTLSSQQTLALFGNKLKFSYNTGDLSQDGTFQFVDSYLDFYGFGNITSQTYTDGAADNVVNHPVVIYRSRNPYSNNYSSPVVNVNPVIDISKLNYFKFSAGFSSPLSAFSNIGSYFSFADVDNTYIRFYKNIVEPSALQTYSIKWYNYYGQAYVNEVLVDVDSSAVEDLGSSYPSFVATNIQAKIQDTSNQFSVIMDGSDSSAVITQAKNASSPGIQQNPNLFNSYLYFYFECPVLSDTYEYASPPDPESSGGDSDSSTGGYDGPDYSEQLALILAKLDLIINNDFNFDIDLTDDLAGIESRLDGVNSRLDGTNSRLDGNNTRLDQANSTLNRIDSHIQALQIPDLESQSSRDKSHIAENDSRFRNELSIANQDKQYLDSIYQMAENSMPNLDNVHSMPDYFDGLWQYEDEDGLKWNNPLLFAMPIISLTIGILSFIVFGRRH